MNGIAKGPGHPSYREEFFFGGLGPQPHSLPQSAVFGDSRPRPWQRPGKREAYLTALELLEMALAKWPKDVQTVRAQFAIAGCYAGGFRRPASIG